MPHESRRFIKSAPARSARTEKSSKSFIPRILIVDDDELLCRELTGLFAQAGYAVSACQQAAQALEELQKENIDIVLTDIRLPDMNGVQLTKRIVEKSPDVPIIVMTGFAEIDTAVQVLKLGASDFIVKPFGASVIQESVKVVLDKSRVFSEIRHLRLRLREKCKFGGMLSRTTEMHEVFETIRMVADTDTTVVVEGETGTGKELVAKAIHHQSARRHGPFVTINCAGVPETLLESELFGYERGAFTGAEHTRAGKIELAHGGTLFLDEIESMPVTMQSKLLLVLEDQRVQRLGSHRWTQIDMRVVAATNIPLMELVSRGSMRSDFYFRLNVVTIRLVPLRMRLVDIPLLVHDFLRHHPIANRKNISTISRGAMEQLMAYHWPGNIRELQNVLEKAVVLARSPVIEKVDVPNTHNHEEPGNERVHTQLPLSEWVSTQEREYLILKLRASRGRVGLAARSCGVDVRTMYRKMRLYGLDKKMFSRRI